MLLSILMPSLQKAKLASHRVICSNDQRQALLLQLTYAADCKGRFPPFTYIEPWTVRDETYSNPVDAQYAANKDSVMVWNYYKPYFGPAISKALVCPATKKFALDDPVYYGSFGDTRWIYKKDYSYGGWDAVKPGTKEAPKVIWIPFNWFNGFRSNIATCDSEYQWLGGEKPWAQNLSEASSKTASIAHIYNSSSQHGENKYRDWSHGGSVLRWGVSPEWQNGIKKNTSIDSPVTYGDGHTEQHIRPTSPLAYKATNNSKLQIRVKFPSKAGIVSICY